MQCKDLDLNWNSYVLPSKPKDYSKSVIHRLVQYLILRDFDGFLIKTNEQPDDEYTPFNLPTKIPDENESINLSYIIYTPRTKQVALYYGTIQIIGGIYILYSAWKHNVYITIITTCIIVIIEIMNQFMIHYFKSKVSTTINFTVDTANIFHTVNMCLQKNNIITACWLPSIQIIQQYPSTMVPNCTFTLTNNHMYDLCNYTQYTCDYTGIVYLIQCMKFLGLTTLFVV